MRLLLLLLLLVSLPARAEEIVLGLSDDEVALTVTFDGQDLLVFGAVSRVAPPPPGELGVIVTVSGPKLPVMVRKQARVAGIWVNTEEALVDAAPSFYAIATNRPLPEILSSVEDLRQSITIPRAIRSVGNEVTNSGDFTDALIRVRRAEGFYRLREGAVALQSDTLFRASFSLPANLIEGNYAVRIFLTRGGGVVDRTETVIGVQKVGVERWLYNLAQEMAWAYGLLALALAILAGWGASAAFRLIRS